MKALIAIDSIETLEILVDEMIARSWPTQTEAQLVSIVDDGDVPLEVWREEGYGVSTVRREMQRRGDQISTLAVERLRRIGIPARVVIMRGNPEFLISYAARKWDADLIMIRAHNRKDFRNRLLGSVAKSVVESAPCSVEVVRVSENASATATDRGFRVLLATDGSAVSTAASAALAAVNWPENTEIRVVSVVNPILYLLEELGLTGRSDIDYAHRAIGNAVHALNTAAVRISAEVIAGSAARRIVERAKHWKADLIVVGTNERRGLRRLILGNTAAAVASRAHCSVRVIRDAKHVSRGRNSVKQRSSPSLKNVDKANSSDETRRAA